MTLHYSSIVTLCFNHIHLCGTAGEQRLINLKCRATIGAVSNPQNKTRVLGKAGANRWRGRRPKVSGPAPMCRWVIWMINAAAMQRGEQHIQAHALQLRLLGCGLHALVDTC